MIIAVLAVLLFISAALLGARYIYIKYLAPEPSSTVTDNRIGSSEPQTETPEPQEYSTEAQSEYESAEINSDQTQASSEI